MNDSLMPTPEEFAAGLPREWMRGPQWASESAREEWAPVLAAAASAWETTELASISAGLRSSALVFLTVEEYVRASADCAANGLELTPLAPAGPLQIRAAVHRPGLASCWRSAWVRQDDEAIGQMLGFPACCREFFVRDVDSKRSDAGRLSCRSRVRHGDPPRLGVRLRLRPGGRSPHPRDA